MNILSKYAPRSLEQFVGNQTVIKHLLSLAEEDSLIRAILLHGPPGNGLTTAGRLFAGKVLGREITGNEGYRAYDYNEVSCSDQFGADRYRDQAVMSIRSGGILDSGRKVYLFDEVHCATDFRQTSLLKPIDEKCDDAFFIFTANDVSSLLPAFRTRCVTYHLRTPEPYQVLDHLNWIVQEEGKIVPPDILDDIVSLSACCVREAKLFLGMILPCQSESEQREILDNIKSSHALCPIRPVGRRNGSSGMNAMGFDSSTAMLQAMEKTVCTSSELMSKSFHPIRTYIRPFLTEDALILLFSEAGTGKTMFVLTILLILTHFQRTEKDSLSFGPFTVENGCRVLFVDGEMRSRDIRSRLEMLSDPMTQENPQTPFEILSSDDIFQEEGKRINLAKEQCREALSEYLRRNPTIGLVVLDNLSSLCPGISENVKTDWDPINTWLLTLRSSGVAVILVHHANKSGGYRGHSAIIGNLDSVIGLKRVGSADTLKFRVDFEKARSAQPGDCKSFIMKGVHRPEGGGLIWEYEPLDIEDDAVDAKDNEIIALILLQKQSQADIAQECGVSQATVSNRKRDAIKKGLMLPDGTVTEDGKAFLNDNFPGLEE